MICLSILQVAIFFAILPWQKAITTEKLSGESSQDCNRCKVLTDSFTNWLQKTSRGKFDGGDAAWEEEKQKSYSRSEVRLVEIQEGLCSDVNKHQDDCYALAEETEQVIETWWFHEDPASSDLFTWLCIDKIKNCCPQSHYGKNCEPCPMDKNNHICGGHGKCHGEGTRTGSGSCICEKGFTGIFCNECSNNYYMEGDACHKCHKSCKGCARAGPSACHSCAPGWVEQSGECTDYDECSDGSMCLDSQFCVNKEGTYKCKDCDSSCKTCKGPGSKNCSSCSQENSLWSGICISEKTKEDLLTNSFRKLALYCGLLIMWLYIIKNTTTIAAVVTILIGSYIFISEKSSLLSVYEVVYNNYFV